jgi:hypothetical protein
MAKCLINIAFYISVYFAAPIRDWNLAQCYETMKLQLDRLTNKELDETAFADQADCSFRWRFYLKINWPLTYDWLYGDAKSP